MSTCALTQGVALVCKDGVGGVAEIRVIEFANLGTVTATSGVISGITPVGGKKFWKYVLPNENVDFQKDGIMADPKTGNTYYQPELQMTIRKLSASLRAEVRTLALVPLSFIVKTRDGLYWLLGEKNGMDMINSEQNTGANRGDFNGYILKFQGGEGQPAQTVDSSIIAALTN